MLKPPLTVDEQISLLQSRGMIIADYSQAKAFLLQNNYYRLNVYFHKFMDRDDHYPKATKFETILQIYENDQWLRNKLLGILEPIEIHAKTSIAYHMGLKYGSGCFYNDEIHDDLQNLKGVKNSFLRELDHNKQEPFVLHHQQIYDGQFPIWVIVELFSFSTISKYYSCLNNKDKSEIATNAFHVNDDFLGSWFRSLSVLRNICAHFGYLFRRSFSVAPRLYKELNLDSQVNQSLFALFLVTRRLSTDQKWSEFISTVSNREEDEVGFYLADYGFPTEWKEYLLN